LKTREGYNSEQLRDLSYEEVLPKLGELQAEVLRCLKYFGEATTEEIADKIGRKVHSVTARIFELRKMELVEFSGKKYHKHQTE